MSSPPGKRVKRVGTKKKPWAVTTKDGKRTGARGSTFTKAVQRELRKLK